MTGGNVENFDQNRIGGKIVVSQKVEELMLKLVGKEQMLEFLQTLFKETKLHGKKDLAQIVFDQNEIWMRSQANKFDLTGSMLILMMRAYTAGYVRQAEERGQIPVDAETLTKELREAMMMGTMTGIPDRLTAIVMKYIAPPKQELPRQK